MTLRCGILTLKTSDSFFRSFRFLRQNEAFSATEQNQTYNHSFFFTIVSLQFSRKFCFRGCQVLITNSKLVISVGKRRGFARRLWFLIRELFHHKKIAVKAKFFRLPRFLSLLISLQFRKKISPSGDFHSNENHRLLGNPHSHQLWI